MTDPAALLAQVSADLAWQLEVVAIDLACAAGAFIRDERPHHLTVSATKSSRLDIVTQMDTASERLIRGMLAARRPQDAILGEEEGISAGREPVVRVAPAATGPPGLSGEPELTWVVDPIDGTVNYLYDLPAYAVSIAVVVGDPTRAGAWAPVAGAVINPRTGELFHARTGGGSWLRALHSETAEAGREGGRESAPAVRLTVPQRDGELATVLLATGFSYDAAAKARQGRVVAELLPHVRDIRRMGAAALDLAHVAAGRVDAYYERGIHVWDMAAGILLVTEAGGVVSGFGTDLPPGREGIIAAREPVHRVLLPRLQHLFSTVD